MALKLRSQLCTFENSTNCNEQSFDPQIYCPLSNVFYCLKRPFSYSEKESQSNDALLHFVEFSNVHNSDRSSNGTRSNVVYKDV